MNLRLERLWAALRSSWRVSLRMRMVSISIGLSVLAVSVIGAYMMLIIQGNLFDSRRDQTVAETQSVTSNVQALFDGSIDSAGFIDIEGANAAAQTTIRATTASPGLAGFAILRSPGQATSQTMTSTSSVGFPLETVSDSLRMAVRADNTVVHYQSVSLPSGSPGIVTGALISVPTAGSYELYLVYDLTDLQTTLTFVQQTLIVGSNFFVLVVGLIVFIVTTRSIRPITMTAETAERFADGALDERIRVEGDDIVATLARSFNKMATSIQEQIVRLGTLSTLQQQFVSDVSHELRTPLTTIKITGNMLYERRHEFDKDTARAAELLHEKIGTFEYLLAELIELSRYDAGAATLEADPVVPVALVNEAVDSMRTLAENKGSELRIHAPGGHGTIQADSRRVRRIITNFLGNAIDHGEGKPIDIIVDSNHTAVSIAVWDHGVGIKPMDIHRVFDRFWRADPSRQRTTGGTGLGMAIAKGDAELHGGTIDVWSEPGNGACFRLTLPRVGDGEIIVPPIALPPVIDEETADA